MTMLAGSRALPIPLRRHLLHTLDVRSGAKSNPVNEYQCIWYGAILLLAAAGAMPVYEAALGAPHKPLLPHAHGGDDARKLTRHGCARAHTRAPRTISWGQNIPCDACTGCGLGRLNWRRLDSRCVRTRRTSLADGAIASDPMDHTSRRLPPLDGPVP